jgi:hypothetical protein
MNAYVNEGDEWSTDGRNILSADQLEKIRAVLSGSGPVIVEHRHYRGSCAPDRLLFNEYDDLQAWLTKSAQPGDAFYLWDYADVCRDENTIASGKYPDSRGRVPRKGAY